MKSIKGKKVLWVDDQITLLEPYCNELRKTGLMLSTALSTPDALEVIKTETFDMFLIDIRMPEPDGIQLLKILTRERFAHSPIFIAFSSFHYLPAYRSRLDNLAVPVEILDKDFPPIGSKEFKERFLAPIIEIAEKGPTPTERKNRALARISGMDPFDITLSSFLRLNLAEKEALLNKAEIIAKKTLDSAFTSGKIWVLLCGAPDKIAASAEKAKEQPNEDVILEFARQLDSAPYQFFKAPQVDDQWMFCNGHYYPTVTLELLSTADPNRKEKVEVHFDTGSPICFYSYEQLLDKGLILPSQLIGKDHDERKGYGKSYIKYILKQPAMLECQSGNGGTKFVKLNGQIVRDWINGPYARICSKKCPYDEDTAKRLCKFRNGLIGSNLLTDTDNGLILALDGIKKQTRIVKSAGGHK